MSKRVLSASILAVLGGAVSFGAQAAAVANGDVLTITAASLDSYGYVSGGSYFGMDSNGNNKITAAEKTGLAQGTTGLVIGVTTPPGASHGGLPAPGDTNAITAPWGFFGNTGSDYLTVAVTGSTTAGLNMSGWTVTWNGIPAIPMGSGAWGSGFANGIGNFTWNGNYGDPYTLLYHATVPVGDPSGFGGVKYELFLTGTVQAAPPVVPLPAAIWLLGSGLMGLVSMGRRKGTEGV